MVLFLWYAFFIQNLLLCTLIISIKKHRQAYQTRRVSDIPSVWKVKHHNSAWLRQETKTASIIDNNHWPFYLLMQWHETGLNEEALPLLQQWQSCLSLVSVPGTIGLTWQLPPLLPPASSAFRGHCSHRHTRPLHWPPPCSVALGTGRCEEGMTGDSDFWGGMGMLWDYWYAPVATQEGVREVSRPGFHQQSWSNWFSNTWVHSYWPGQMTTSLYYILNIFDMLNKTSLRLPHPLRPRRAPVQT